MSDKTISRQAGNPERKPQDNRRTGKLMPGGIYLGVVMHSHPVSKLFDVFIPGRGEWIKDCVWAGCVMSNMVGIKTSYMPPAGSRVWILYDGKGYGLGMAPTDAPDKLAGGSRTLSGVPEAAQSAWETPKAERDASSFLGTGPTPGQDALEGEYELTNSMGVGLALLTTIARLQSGDRAKVETFLLNDMVRIVSENFRHFSSFGDFEIYNDGRLNVVFNGTSYEHEAWGRMTDKEPKVPTKGTNSVDFSNIKAMEETGRWRFSEFVGWLGDFFHQIISDPINAVGTYAQEVARSGRARTQVMADGTILMQSVADIVFERVSRVQVPIPLKRWEDPKGNLKKQMSENLNKQYLRLWQNSDKPHDMATACYQLREYARWLNQFHSFSRFMQLTKDWKVPAESEVPEPDAGCREKDRQDINSEVGYIETYSTIRIMRDGSQVHFDGWGNAILMSEYGMQFSTPRHMEFNSGGDMIFNAGQNIRVKARRSIDIVSVLGGIKMKARAWLQFLCELGTLWLKSDAPESDGEAHDTGAEVEPENLGHAIRIDAPLSKIWIQADKGMVTDVKEEDYTVQAHSGEVNLMSFGDHGVNVKAGKNINLFAKYTIADSKMAVLRQDFHVGKYFYVRGGRVSAIRVDASTLNSKGSIRGPRMSRGEPSHSNHISTIPDSFTVSFGDLPESSEAPEVVPSSMNVNWRFLSQDEYIWDTDYKLRQTLSQQFMALGDKLPGAVAQPSYGEWDYDSTDKLLKAPRTAGGTRPWPCGHLQEVYDGGDSLHSPSSKPPDKHDATPKGLKGQAVIHKYLK